MKARITTLAGILLLAPGWALADGPQPAKASTPEGDLKKLDGKWGSADEQALRWTVTVKVAVDGKTVRGEDAAWVLERGKGTFRLAVNGPFEVKEVGKQRVIAPDEVAVLAGLPKAIGYRFAGETLVLTVPDGDFKGEYKLKRVKEGAGRGAGLHD